jgi:predicted Zn-dependent peptidase
VVEINLLVRAGYRFETKEELGYAHLLEHMLLKGTKRLPAPELVNEQVACIGGYQNAGTNDERVNYIIEVAKEYAKPMCGLLREMFFESLIDPERLEKEKKIVLQEYEDIRSNNERYTMIQAQAAFYHGHPVGVSILDADETTKRATAESLRAYMQKWYVPGRSALIIGGGLSHADAVRLATQNFGDWAPAGAVPLELVSFIPDHPRHLHVTRDVPSTMIGILYHGPTVEQPKDEAALSVVATFLSYSSSSLLSKELRHKRALVYSASTRAGADRDTGEFTVSSSTAHDPAEVIGLLRQFVENVPEYLAADGVEYIKRQKLGALVRSMAEVSDRTNHIFGNFVTMDRLYLPEEWERAIRDVTYGDIVAACAKYLRRDNSMLVTMGRSDPGDL